MIASEIERCTERPFSGRASDRCIGRATIEEQPSRTSGSWTAAFSKIPRSHCALARNAERVGKARVGAVHSPEPAVEEVVRQLRQREERNDQRQERIGGKG